MEDILPPSLYLKSPDYDIELDEFATLPNRRLEAIRLLREGNIGQGAVGREDARTADARYLLFQGHGEGPSESKYRRVDIASHFILKLACCGGSNDKGEDKERLRDDSELTRDRQEWFVRAERDLFRTRLHWHVQGAVSGGSIDQESSIQKETKHAEVDGRHEALRIVYELGWLQPVTLDRDYLDFEGGRLWNTSGGSGTCRYLSCPFERVPRLVKSRQVLLLDGKAFLTPRQISAAVVQYFEDRLKSGISVAKRCLPGVEADERVAGILQKVRRDVDTYIYGRNTMGPRHDRLLASAMAITKDNIDHIAGKTFPLCMRRTLRILRREHHLKYQARIQLVSFLANAGMDVGELLRLWREEFAKGMPPEDYARKRSQYEYSLRHIYGLEGRRKMFRPQSCARIASGGWGGSGNGGYGHGCPFYAFRHLPESRNGGCGLGGGSDASMLSGKRISDGRNGSITREMLTEQNLCVADIEDIVSPLESVPGPTKTGCCGGIGSAVSACSRHFSATHRWAAGGFTWDGGSGELEASPNGWFAASNHSQPDAFMTQQKTRFGVAGDGAVS